MSTQAAEKAPTIPEKHLETACQAGNNTLPAVDRVALLKDFKPGEHGVGQTAGLPKVEITGGNTATRDAVANKDASANPGDATKGTAPAVKTDAGCNGAPDLSKGSRDGAGDIKPDLFTGSRNGEGDVTGPAVGDKATADTKQQAVVNAKHALESPEASAKEKMQALSALYDNSEKGPDGNVRITLNDGGKPRDFEISKEQVSRGVNLLQLSAAGEDGRSHPVLRAVERQGQIEQQRYNSGQKASYQGDWWSAHEPQSTVAKFATRDQDPGQSPSYQGHDHQRHRRHPHQPPEAPPQSAPPTPTKGSETGRPDDAARRPYPNSDVPPAPQGQTAIYDISAHTVYLPNGERLEAHSGLGRMEDDPRYASVRGSGPTPPNTYDLSLRGGLFHGVQALRLNPEDGSKMHGRDGILAHTYMRGPSGQSSGCVVFKNYSAFLRAYEHGQIKRLLVVPHL